MSDLLHDTLQAAVPLWMFELRTVTDDERVQLARETAGYIAEHGHDILSKSRQPGDTAKAFNALAKGLAALAFQPGGIDFAGMHFCVNHAGCATARPRGVLTEREGGAWSFEGKVRKSKPPKFPASPDAKPDEAYYHVYSEVDELGRARFVRYWYDADLPNRGAVGEPSPGTTFGQVFYADVREYIRRDLAEGCRVFWWPSGEELHGEGV